MTRHIPPRSLFVTTISLASCHLPGGPFGPYAYLFSGVSSSSLVTPALRFMYWIVDGLLLKVHPCLRYVPALSSLCRNVLTTPPSPLHLHPAATTDPPALNVAVAATPSTSPFRRTRRGAARLFAVFAHNTLGSALQFPTPPPLAARHAASSTRCDAVHVDIDTCAAIKPTWFFFNECAERRTHRDGKERTTREEMREGVTAQGWGL
ncbi:hypothetical protein R3P38DRAFT_3210640 [Favolaschia claudopus]|uniref:Secreted protein n=1 Tax=Favolaschia claudopus TaxID=2862362 RepID=A0AAW0AH26_9AGAR